MSNRLRALIEFITNNDPSEELKKYILFELGELAVDWDMYSLHGDRYPNANKIIKEAWDNFEAKTGRRSNP